MANPPNSANGIGMSYNYNEGTYHFRESNIDVSYIPKEKLDPAFVNTVDALTTVIRHQQSEIERLTKMVNELYFPMRSRE